MRPPDRTPDCLYECFDCGKRTRDPAGTRCPDCDGRMWNIAQPRDL